MRLKPYSLPLLALMALPAGSALAEDYDGRFYLAPMYSHILEDKARPSQNGMGGTLAIGKRVASHVELELFGSYIAYEEDDRRQSNLLCNLLNTCKTFEGGTYESKTVGAAANIFFSPASQGAYVRLDAQAGSGDRFLYDGGLGYRWMLNDNVGVRAEALYHDDDGEYQETQINLGLHILLGSKPLPPAPPAEPVAVVPVEAPPPPPCAMPEAGQPVNFDNCKAGDVMVLRGVHFATADSTLTADAEAILDGVATALVAKPDLRVEVQGHTDSVGEDDYNQALSQRRAKSVKTYLAEHGVDASRMHSLGFGETQPVDSNDTDEGRELNRRVELKLVAADAPAFGPDEEPVAVKRKKAAAVEAESTDATAPAEGDTSSSGTDAVMSTEEEAALVQDAQGTDAGTEAAAPADASSTDASSTEATATEAAPADAGASSEPALADSTTTTP